MDDHVYWSRERMNALAAIADQAETSTLAGTGTISAAAVPVSPPDWAAEFRAALGEPLGLPDDQLPPYETTPDGTCRTCHLGPLYQRGRCLYCHTLGQLRMAAGTDRTRPRPRIQARHRPLLAPRPLLVLGVVLIVLAFVVPGFPGVSLAGLACFLLAGLRWPR